MLFVPLPTTSKYRRVHLLPECIALDLIFSIWQMPHLHRFSAHFDHGLYPTSANVLECFQCSRDVLNVGSPSKTFSETCSIFDASRRTLDNPIAVQSMRALLTSPMNGSVAWTASPISTILPFDQVGNGGKSVMFQT